MDVKITNTLTKLEIEHIRELEQICNRVDGTSYNAYLSSELNVSRSYPCFFLGYDCGLLVAFLTAFFPDKSAAELTACVHPLYRKRKNSAKLFHIAESIYSALYFKKIQFCIRSDSRNGLAAAQSFGNITFDRTEYTLRLGRYTPSTAENRLNLVKVDRENLGSFKPYAAQCYDLGERDSLTSAAESQERTAYAALDGGHTVGFFMLYHDGGAINIHGVAVSKKQRGKGYGKLMMDLAVKEALSFGKPVFLDVDSNNETAHHLYTSVGFVEESHTDYYNYILHPEK